MDAKTCILKLSYVGVLNFATVDQNGLPQVRCISAVHYEENSFWFLTARGKEFYHQLIEDGHVPILVYTRFKEMIRVSAVAKRLPDEVQESCRNTIWEEQPYMENVYPNGTREILEAFEIKDMQMEYFNLGTHPIGRYYYTVGNAEPIVKGYHISDACIQCGTCAEGCPQNAIDEGEPFVIHQDHCLQCGRCYENCPVQAIERL
ncbi:4Fe-4S binding protein [uncultured Mitsuokella sp.]|uniref:4Fe-4S binding protein n=1 Tax=uncultured Mitsuokella sp. TaxID=453120 RepID=UPI002603C0C5|nr:4Fe-4S binding protein [uncultured Mitsuokella sp.]